MNIRVISLILQTNMKITLHAQVLMYPSKISLHKKIFRKKHKAKHDPDNESEEKKKSSSTITSS